MGHRRTNSESATIFTNPSKIKPKPLSVPRSCLASCFLPDTAETPSCRSRPLAACRPDPKPKSRFGRWRHNSADFQYDPVSYALNFDDGGAAVAEADPATPQEFWCRNFLDRLPASPTRESGPRRLCSDFVGN